MPKWAPEALARFIPPGEPLVTACPGTHLVSDSGKVTAAFLGNAAAAQVELPDQQPRYGLAGSIPAGRVLIATTPHRLLVHTADPQFRPVWPVVAYTAEHLAEGKYSNTVRANKQLIITFVDGTKANIALPEHALWDPGPYATATARQIFAIRSAARPPG
jgi:hypothetical protein